MKSLELIDLMRATVLVIMIGILSYPFISNADNIQNQGAYSSSDASGLGNPFINGNYNRNIYDRNPYYKQDPNKASKTRRDIHSVVATGFNDLLGKPPFDLGAPFGTFGFTSMGIYNEFGSVPLPLNENVPDSSLLATAVHPNFLGLAGKTRADVDPELENILLRDVPVNVDFAFVNREKLRGEFQADPLEVSQAEPANNITLGQWMEASGVAKIVCKSNRHATLKITTSSLIPNRMYGVWATLGGEFLSSFPIGGAPTMFMTDEYGDGKFKRELNFCPLDKDSADRPVLVINVVYYSSHQNFGAVPEPVFVDGFWLGTVTHNHLQFPINVVKLGK